MKKVFAVILALSMLFLCSGCSIDVEMIKQKAEAIINNSGSSPKSNFVFTDENYPKIGASLSTVPLAAAFTSAALGVSGSEAEAMISYNAPLNDSYKALCDGKLDLLLAYSPGKEAKKYAKKQGVELEMTPIAVDALVFICSKENKAEDLTTQQIEEIYSGKLTSWRKINGEKEDIIPYQRTEGSDSRQLFDKLIGLGDRLMPAPKIYKAESGDGLSEAVADYNNDKYALGYTVYYYLTNTEKDRLSYTKMLSVNGVAPSNETISDGTYPLTSEIYVVIKGSAEAESPERILYNWICSSQGKELSQKQKYPVKEVS